jgi:toxin-antitoxin system PIN domain toxin
MTETSHGCLVDVNVWIALLLPANPHHRVVAAWFEQLEPETACLCRSVQLSIVRLLANRSMMGKYALFAVEAWQMVVAQLLQNERVKFVNEPLHIEKVLPDLLYQQEPSGQLVMDAYLAAFAMAAEYELVTLDAGFRKFRGLDLNLIR